MQVFTMEVRPEGTNNEAYRILQASENITMDELCHLILEAFNFDSSHLYAFCLGPGIVGPAVIRYESMPKWREPSTKEVLSRLKLCKGKRFFLHYDFGDDWIFAITVLAADESDAGNVQRILESSGTVDQYGNYSEDEWEDEE